MLTVTPDGTVRPPRTYVTQEQILDARRDIRIENHGSLVLLRPYRRHARLWLREHVDTNGRWWGPPSASALVVEPRFVADTAGDDAVCPPTDQLGQSRVDRCDIGAIEFRPPLPAPAFAGTPGKANCHGKSVSALARQFGGIDAAASALGFASVQALQDATRTFCEE
jgi:hypothetical protein